MKTRVIFVVMVLVLGLTVNAMADVATIELTVPNDDISPYPGPYASISINRTSLDTALITATTFYPPYLLGGAQALDLNTLGGSATATGFSWSGGNSNTSFTQQTNPIPQNVDGFGDFNVVIDGFAGFASAVNQLSFTLTNTSSTDWLSALGVLTANNKDYLAAAHIFVSNQDGTDALATGFAANGPVAVPEPGMMLLFGSGLVGLAGLRRKFRV